MNFRAVVVDVIHLLGCVQAVYTMAGALNQVSAAVNFERHTGPAAAAG